MVKQPSKEFFKKDVMRNFAEFIRKRLRFLVNFAEFVRTPFSKNSTGRLLLIIAVSTVVKGVLANETVNYDTHTKAYVKFEPEVQVIKSTVQVKE